MPPVFPMGGFARPSHVGILRWTYGGIAPIARLAPAPRTSVCAEVPAALGASGCVGSVEVDLAQRTVPHGRTAGMPDRAEAASSRAVVPTVAGQEMGRCARRNFGGTPRGVPRSVGGWEDG